MLAVRKHTLCPYRSRIRRAKNGRKLLAEVEKRLGQRLRFVRGTESEYDPNERVIQIGPQSLFRKLRLDFSWKNHLLFHEFGHAVIDAFRDKFDRSAERRIFGGLTSGRYPENNFERALKGGVEAVTRSSTTFYGKTHAEEAWAEAFSFVLANVADNKESEKVIQQLAYADWVIENIVKERKSWGRFKMPTTPVECECGEIFDLECRSGSDTRGWEVDCPACEDTLVLDR
jgi:hypothetical protein